MNFVRSFVYRQIVNMIGDYSTGLYVMGKKHSNFPNTLIRCYYHIHHMLACETQPHCETARLTTYNYHLSSSLGMGIYEGCFIFDFASLPLEVTRAISLPHARKWPENINQSSYGKNPPCSHPNAKQNETLDYTITSHPVLQ